MCFDQLYKAQIFKIMTIETKTPSTIVSSIMYPHKYDSIVTCTDLITFIPKKS